MPWWMAITVSKQSNVVDDLSLLDLSTSAGAFGGIGSGDTVDVLNIQRNMLTHTYRHKSL